jgi:hypothetical protein
MKTQTFLITAIAALGIAVPAQADTVKAHCEYVANGAKRAEASMPCQIYQSQGHVVITWQDSVVNDFIPLRPDVYRDQRGGSVYRKVNEKGGDWIFRMEKGTILVKFQ